MAFAYVLDPCLQHQNRAGVNNVHGYFKVYLAGTDDLAETYSDFGGSLNPENIEIDNNGRCVIIADSSQPYRVEMYLPNGDLVYTQEPVWTLASGGGASIIDIESSDASVQIDKTTVGGKVIYDLSVSEDDPNRLDWIKCIGAQLVDGIYVPQKSAGTLSMGEKGISLEAEMYYHATVRVKATKNQQRLPYYDEVNVVLGLWDGKTTATIGTCKRIVDYSLGLSQEFEVGADVKVGNLNSQLVISITGQDHQGGDFEIPEVDLHRVYSGVARLPAGVATRAWVNENFQKKLVAGENITIDPVTNIISAIPSENVQADWTETNSTDPSYIQNKPDLATVATSGSYNDLSDKPTINNVPAVMQNDAGKVLTASYRGGVGSYSWETGGGGGGGTTYAAGDAIDLTNDTISVKYNKGLEITTDNKLQLKVGKGLTFDDDTLEVTIDNSVGAVVETVEKLQNDLDKKITTTYPFAQITTMSDFAVYGVTNTSRMIGQLFAVPIASEIRKDETLLCVNALQNFSGNVSFGIFEYDFAANNGTGSTYWIADTGTVRIQSGENKFKLKNVLNNNYEMKSSMLYYAVVAIAGNAPANGLLLGSSPAYSQNVNANPKYTLIVSNMDQAIDWNTGTLQGAYFQGHSEQYDIPRLFMMLRNVEGSAPIPVTEPFADIGSFTLQRQYKVSDLFSIVPNAEGAVYRKVIPTQDVDITSFRYADYHDSVGQQSPFPVLLDGTYTPMKTVGDGTWTIGNSDQAKIDGTHYVHEFTFTAPVHLTADTAYWFMVGGNMNNLGDEWLITYQTPSVTNDLLLVKSMYYVNSWIIPDNGEYRSSKPGMYLRLSDGTESWVI